MQTKNKQTSIKIGLLVTIAASTLLFVGLTEQEAATLVMIIRTELVALFLSSLAAYIYTNIDFVEQSETHVLGRIFLGVHILVGLVQWGTLFVLHSSSALGV